MCYLTWRLELAIHRQTRENLSFVVLFTPYKGFIALGCVIDVPYYCVRWPAAATGSLSTSFSLDPYDLLKLAGSRISSQCHAGPSPRRRDPGRLPLMERTVQLAGVVVVHRRWTGVFAWSIGQGVISLSESSLTVNLITIGVFWITVLLCVALLLLLRLSYDSPSVRDSEATDQCPSLTIGHPNPEASRYGEHRLKHQRNTLRRCGWRAYRRPLSAPPWWHSEDLKDQNRKLSTGQRSEVGKSRKTIENWITRSQRTKVLRMFSVSVPRPFRSLRTDRLWGTLPMVAYWDHPLSYDPCKDTPPPPMYENNPCQLHRPLHQWSLPRSRLLGDDKAWNCILCGQNPWPCQLQGVTWI